VPVSAYIVKTVNEAGPLGPAHKKVVGEGLENTRTLRV
jgi:hypothetical protein